MIALVMEHVGQVPRDEEHFREHEGGVAGTACTKVTALARSGSRAAWSNSRPEAFRVSRRAAKRQDMARTFITNSLESPTRSDLRAGGRDVPAGSYWPGRL